MYTYVQRPGCKKENTATYVYIRAGSRTPTRAYVRPGLVYMAGSERRNSVVVVFMGSQPAGSERNAWPCSSGGLGRNRRWKRGLAYRRTEETALCSTGHVRNGILFIGRGLAYHKTEETDLCWSTTVETGVLFIGRGVAYRKTGLHGILFISTVDLLQPPRATVDLLQPPRAPVHPASTARYSTGYCSTTPPRAPLHRLLFIQPSTGWSYSTSPPRGPVHPAPTVLIGVMFIQRQHHGVLFIHPHRELFIQTPQQRSLFIQRQHRSASVSSSSEGIARSGSVNSHRSIARVQ